MAEIRGLCRIKQIEYMEKKFDYEAAVKRLEKLVAEIEDPSVAVAKLPEKVEEAVSLIEQCRGFLQKSEDSINKIVNFEG